MKNQGFYDCLEEMLISSILVRVTQGDIAHLTSHISHLGGSVSFPMDVSGWQGGSAPSSYSTVQIGRVINQPGNK